MLSSRGKGDEPPLINMTPMVNVILCLLVFFMAATRLYDWDENEFVVNVPEVSEAAPLTAAPDDLALTISRRGAVVVGDKTYDLNGLVVLLREAREQYINQGVVIRGDASLTYRTWPMCSRPATRRASATSSSPCDPATSERARPAHRPPLERETDRAADPTILRQ